MVQVEGMKASNAWRLHNQLEPQYVEADFCTMANQINAGVDPMITCIERLWRQFNREIISRMIFEDLILLDAISLYGCRIREGFKRETR